MADKPPTRRQLNYLKALAERTGQTFQWPHSTAAASREIHRLKNTRPSCTLERAIERFGDPQAIEADPGRRGDPGLRGRRLRIGLHVEATVMSGLSATTETLADGGRASLATSLGATRSRTVASACCVGGVSTARRS